MKQKIVIKLQLSCDKCRSKALKTASLANGVNSVAIQGKDKNEIVVIGDGVDSVCLTSSLRKKVGWAELVSVEEVKPKAEEKKKEKEKDPKKEKEKDPIQYPSSFYQCQHPEFYICEPVYNSDPFNCSIL